MQYHYVNENYKNGIINIIKNDFKKNLADILTKSLDEIKFIKNREGLKIM